MIKLEVLERTRKASDFVSIMAANAGAGSGADFAALVGRQSLTTQHAELFQSYIPGEPTGSMIINPHSASPHQKKVFSPATFDLRNDIYAPRALGYAAAKMTTTFPQGDTGGSFAGSPPRARDKFIPGSSDITATMHADLKKSWFEGNKKGGKNGPRSHKDGRISQGLHSVNDRVFLRGDPWVRDHCPNHRRRASQRPQRNCRRCRRRATVGTPWAAALLRWPAAAASDGGRRATDADVCACALLAFSCLRRSRTNPGAHYRAGG
jgi:hypothetical protein